MAFRLNAQNRVEKSIVLQLMDIRNGLRYVDSVAPIFFVFNGIPNDSVDFLVNYNKTKYKLVLDKNGLD